MTDTAWTNDAGRAADRIASVNPAELHRAICQAAVDGIRAGLPAELLDGHTVTRADGLLGAIRDQRGDKLAHLDQEIAAAHRQREQARNNANRASTSELAAEFLEDASTLLDRARQLEKQRAELLATDDTAPVTEFDSGADYVAHALARLATIERDAHGAIGDALSHILDFTDVDVTEPGRVGLTFHIKVPADGRVARLGPLHASVRNHAYRNTVARDARGDIPRRVLAGVATANGLASQLGTSAHQILTEVTAELHKAGYTPLAAGTAVRSGLGPVYAVLTHDLWNEPLPDHLDPDYVAHILTTYKNPDFAWDHRYHALDCTLRQQLIDTVHAAGGVITMADAVSRLTGTRVDHLRIANFTRTQQVGDAPPWPPCLERQGNWARQAPRTMRFLTTHTCPHCSDPITKAVRTPETADGLLCRICRRTPRPDSPTYPDDYLAL